MQQKIIDKGGIINITIGTRRIAMIMAIVTLLLIASLCTLLQQEISAESAKSVSVYGGDGGKGGDGGNGGNGGRGVDGEWFGAPTIPSGDAGNGGYGGDAGNGIEAKMIEGSYTAIAGTPGAAGIGGKEGKPGNPPGHTVLGNEKFGQEGTKGSDGEQGAEGSKFVLI